MEDLKFGFRGSGLTKIILTEACIDSPDLLALQIRRVRSFGPLTIENEGFCMNGTWEMDGLDIGELSPLERMETFFFRLSIKKSTLHSPLLYRIVEGGDNFGLHLEETVLLQT